MPSADGEIGARSALPPNARAPHLAVIDTIRALHRKARWALKQRVKLDNGLLAYIRVSLGWSPDMTEAEHTKVSARARAIVAAVEANKPAGTDGELFAGLIMTNAQSRDPLKKMEDDAVKDMEKWVRMLPGYGFVKATKGFGDASFARIVGEAGDIGSYANPGKLYKRMGVAVFDGRRQGAPEHTSDKAEMDQRWIAHGYNRRRRSESWNAVSSMFKHQWRGDRDADGNNPAETKKPVAVPAHAIGPYGEVYGNRKVEETAKNEAGDYAEQAAEQVRKLRAAKKPVPQLNLDGKLTAAHIDNRARRYMEKRVIKHLWQAWRADVRNGGAS